jgi:hypothetical protein
MRSISAATACSSAARTSPGLAAHRASRTTQSARFRGFSLIGCSSFCHLQLRFCVTIVQASLLIGRHRRRGVGQNIADGGYEAQSDAS